MTTFATIQGPFLNGLRPKTFFAERKKMMNDAKIFSDGGLKYFPGWNLNKKEKQKDNYQANSSYRVFLESLPWSLALAQLMYIIIF